MVESLSVECLNNDEDEGKKSQDLGCCNILACPLALTWTFYFFCVGHKFTDNRQAFKSLDHVIYTQSRPNHQRIALKDRPDCSSQFSVWEKQLVVTNLLKMDFPLALAILCWYGVGLADQHILTGKATWSVWSFRWNWSKFFLQGKPIVVWCSTRINS